MITRAYGESMDGVPATTRMHFRNGAVAISYMSTLLLRLVDQGKVKLDDPVSKWLPTLRNSDKVTLEMLARMTAGYHDFEQDPRLDDTIYSNPFGNFSTQMQLDMMLDEPQQFVPGTNWSYSHSNYVVLGLALERITGQPLEVAIRDQVLRPLGLRNTVANQKSPIPEPALHAYSAERRQFLRIPNNVRFLEESTYWNPSWILARGSVETTNIFDMTRTAIGIGSGRLISRGLYERMMDPHIGFGRPQAGCERCQTLNRFYGYGIGRVRNGAWDLQNPLFYGFGAVEAYLPSERISIAVATTWGERGYDNQGNVRSNSFTNLYAAIGAIMAPNNRPPVPRRG